MVRKLKFHERLLLKKFDFIQWKTDRTLHENKILRRFYIQKRDDYTAYFNGANEIRSLVADLEKLDEENPKRIIIQKRLLEKLYNAGFINTKTDIEAVKNLSASSFCRRRLAVIVHKLKMAENIKAAVTLIEQGHIRVGTEMVNDPAMIISRNLEDYVTWVNKSAIRKQVQEYNGVGNTGYLNYPLESDNWMDN